MGAWCSSAEFKEEKDNRQDVSGKDMRDLIVRVDSPAEYDQQFVERLRMEFKNDLESFLLNHILMSVLFFENYDRDMLKLSSSVSDWERMYNKRMISEQQKQCLMPDIVFELVNKNMRYRPFHGPKKTVSEPISPQRLFILHENIEVPDPYDNSVYSNIDKPAYKASLKESDDHKGFVKVEQLEYKSKKPVLYHDTTRSNSDESLYEPNPSTSRGEASTSGISTSQGSDSEYYYTRISEFKTPMPLNIGESDIYTTIGTLPSKCLTPVRIKNPDITDEDLEDDDNENYIRKSSDKFKLYIYVNYFNSKEFMLHFADRVFPNVLGEVLGFNMDEILNATSAECKVYCDTCDENGNLIQCEILPAIAIPWPTLAYEWSARHRPAVTDTRAMIRYQWPTEKMVREIKSMSCVIIPKGYMPKRNKQTNPNMQLEWEVAFPKAERYLETKMSHAQMRCYLTLLILHKTFIEPLTKKQGLLAEHIRTLIFWECERNYLAWNDCKLWNKLYDLLQTLNRSLSSCTLPDYFIKSKNVFQNVRTKHLVAAQEVIFRMLESPVPHLIRALRNLRCMYGRFYPTPDLKKLYEILLFRDPTYFLPSPYLSPSKSMASNHIGKMKRSINPDKDQEWRMRALEKQQMERPKRQNQQQKRKESVNLNRRRSSVDSIDMNIFENYSMDDIKRRSVLLFFIDHFISIAKTSNRIGSVKQTLFYLKQAWYLTRLLADTAANQSDVIMYEKIISKEEETCHRKAEKLLNPTSPPSSPAPSPPRRNSTIITSNGTKSLKSQFSNEEKSTFTYNESDENVIGVRKTISFRADKHSETTSF